MQNIQNVFYKIFMIFSLCNYLELKKNAYAIYFAETYFMITDFNGTRFEIDENYIS